jgi:hypothetical protein
MNIHRGSQSQASAVPLLDAWLRAPDCYIDGDHVVAKGPVIWYSPASVKNLTADLASIEDAAGALRFVAEYGPLELPPEVSRARLRSGVTELEWRGSVAGILKEAEKAARIRKTGALFTDARPEIQKNLASTLIGLWKLKFGLDRQSPELISEPISEIRISQIIGEFIVQMLNEHLPRSCERARINVPGEFRSVLTFESLLAVVYRRLFHELRRGKLRLCQECGTVFEWADPRQMYCSKRCGLNLAQRRHRARKAKKGS